MVALKVGVQMGVVGKAEEVVVKQAVGVDKVAAMEMEGVTVGAHVKLAGKDSCRIDSRSAQTHKSPAAVMQTTD